MKAVFDTNILIDYLKGSAQAKQEIARYQNPQISMVTWIEVMAGAHEKQDIAVRKFLNRFNLVELSQAVAEETVKLRKLYKIRLPDAVIWASARTNQCLLVTRDTDDFPKDDVTIRVPY